jgi:hypothetical protein
MLKEIYRIFKKNEIDSAEEFHHDFISRKKIVTFVPLNFVDKLTFEMAFAGAGIIGNYEICSFRMKGLGTFKPVADAKPFSGKKGKVAYEEEVRLEMECDEENLDNVINALLLNHPYDEAAYEIYDFQKRAKEPSGYVLNFKKSFELKELLKRLNNNLDYKNLNLEKKIKKLAFVNSKLNKNILRKVLIHKCDYLLTFENNNKILIKT